MEYTKNYHLPQWEETDRIMRVDFNQMCADIEEGMSENREAGEELAQRITAAEAGAVGAAQAGLFRLAYNHWHYLDALASKPRQMGFFQQSFGKDQTAVEGMLQLDDCCWMANGEETLSMDNIRPSFVPGTGLSSTENTKTAFATFTAPYSGYLTYVGLHGSTYSTENVRTTYTARIYENGIQIAEKTGNFSILQGSSYGSHRFSVEATLHAGKQYRVTVTLADFPASVTLAFSAKQDPLTVSGVQLAEAAVSQQFQTGESSQGGLILVHYKPYGTGGTLTLDWEGETLTPHLTRNITRNGTAMKEAEFRISKTIPGDSTVTLDLQCANKGELFLYGWGGLLI